VARIQYPEVGDAPLVQRIVEERGSLLNLYRMLLHHQGIAEGWLRLGTAIGEELSLDHRTRELVVCAVAADLDADYEWHHHAPAARHRGIADEQLDALRTGSPDAFDDHDRAVLDAVDALSHRPAEAGPALAALQAWHTDAEIFELTVVVGFYWMVTRATIGLDLELDEQVSMSRAG
jgi:alkylhydroperoxidase family enzyme